MDFVKLLKELFVYDSFKIYNIIQIQIAFYCFNNYCQKRILDSFEVIDDPPFESLCELYEIFLPDKKNISLLIENLDDFELLEPFILQLAKTLDVFLTSEDDILQNSFAIFLDKEVFLFFKETIPKEQLFYTEVNELINETLQQLLKDINVESDIIVKEEVEVKEVKEEVKDIQRAFHIRKKTLRKRNNITPMKSRRFKNKSMKK